MAVALADLVSRLQDAVVEYSGIPSTSQYEQAVQDAVADIADRMAMRKRHTLSIVSGTATYTLPDDFLSAIKLESSWSKTSDVMVTDSGIIPVGADFSEEYTIAGLEITFYPTPTYTTTRYLWYRAGYVPDGSEIYQEMTANVGRLAMMKAEAICLRWQANKAAQDAWQYQAGDEKVSKEKLAEVLAKQAEKIETAYLAAIKEKAGPIGMRPYR